MVGLFDLWLPILLSGVFVFIVSSVIHMVLPIHKGDYKKLQGETELLAAMRDQGVQPGQYVFPCAGSMREMATPEMIEKLNLGPVGFLSVMPNGPMNMGKSLGQWFAYSIVVGIFVAYAASMGLDTASTGMDVFRMTGAVALLGYGLSSVPDSIWKGVSWGITWRFLFDGILYGLATGAAFALLWPSPVE